MKNLGVFAFFCLISFNAFANDPAGFSGGLGFSALGLDVGANINVATPYFISKRGALGLQVSELVGTTSATYTVIQFNQFSKIYSDGMVNFYSKTGEFVVPPNALSNQTAMGISFAVGGRYAIPDSSFQFQAEAGVSFPFYGRSSSQTVGQGASVVIGWAYSP